MGKGRGALVLPTRWTEKQLDDDRLLAIETFRRERLEEPTEEFSEQFETAQRAMEDLLELTLDLTQVQENAFTILTQARLRDAFRYIAGPPISIDDLKTLVDTNSIAPKTLKENPAMAQRMVDTIFAGLDRGRFPWLAYPQREATAEERSAAILASATLVASQKVATSRRTKGKRAQEKFVRETLIGLGFKEIKIPGGVAKTLRDAPQPGEFCKETTLATRKADLIAGLWDGRIMPIECKVSNSSINSVKRLNNDAAVKSRIWSDRLGPDNVVPVAVLSGVYWLQKLGEAQDEYLTLYWAHRLKDMTDWIQSTKS